MVVGYPCIHGLIVFPARSGDRIVVVEQSVRLLLSLYLVSFICVFNLIANVMYMSQYLDFYTAIVVGYSICIRQTIYPTLYGHRIMVEK